jgi:hypothetical protein
MEASNNVVGPPITLVDSSECAVENPSDNCCTERCGVKYYIIEGTTQGPSILTPTRRERTLSILIF